MHLTTSNQWPVWQLILFRFAFVFFSLYIIIQNNGAFPFWDVLITYPTEGLHLFIPWIADTFLSLDERITVFTNGSGDTTYDNVIVLTIFVISIFSMIIWSVLDRNRQNYDQLYAWLLVGIRFYVGLMLINYGMVKVFKMQFSSPGPYRLLQSYGDSSPMGLAWTFLGFSKGYNYFMGLAELSAVLLLFRRTATFGAILTLATSLNIMSINYFYDVPVKLLSTSLAVMSAVILLHDAKRLITFFFTSNPVSLPAFPSPRISIKPLKIGLVSVKYLVIGYVCIWGAYETYGMMDEWGDAAPKDLFYGAYDVQEFVLNGDTLPPMKNNSRRWDRFMVQWKGYAQAKMMDQSPKYLQIEQDTVASTVNIKMGRDTVGAVINYVLTDSTLVFDGVLDQDTLLIAMKKIDLDKMNLTGRGFNWINEYPYNR